MIPNLLATVLVLCAQAKQPVPDEGALKEAEKTVREVFKDELAKKLPAEKLSLAKKLLAQGRDSTNAAPSKYAMLVLAVDLSVQASDIDTSLMALTELCQTFEVDVVKQRSTALGSLSKTAKTAEESKAIARAYLQLADEAMKSDRFDDAGKAVDAAGAQAKKAKDVGSVTSSDAKVKEVAARKAKYEKVRGAREVLAAKPDDAAANLAVGQYLCVVKGDWTAGIPLLAKGSDGPFKTIALKELAGTLPPEEQTSVGDAWWGLAEKSQGDEKFAIRERAEHWYQQVLSSLTGLEQKRISDRLAQCTIDRLGRGNWIDLNDPGLFGHPGKVGEPIEKIVPKSGNTALLSSKPLPPGEYDAFQMRVRLGERGSTNLVLTGPGYKNRINMGLKANEGTLNLPGPNWPTPPIHTEPLPVLGEYLVIVVMTKDEDIFYLNGREMRRWPAQGPFDKIEMWTIFGELKYDKIRIRKRA